MDVVYYFQGAAFEWDTRKAQANLEKHNVSFEEAVEVFFDPFYRFGDATRRDEQREFVLGYSLSQRILLVVHVDRGEQTRIVSARAATRQERKQYERA